MAKTSKIVKNEERKVLVARHAAKRRALLRHFGGLQGVLKAGVADLERVQGIGATLARSLYDHLHPGE
mgnify:CR=1 FL=1